MASSKIILENDLTEGDVCHVQMRPKAVPIEGRVLACGKLQ